MVKTIDQKEKTSYNQINTNNNDYYLKMVLQKGVWNHGIKRQ